jgi:hypothetical protein
VAALLERLTWPMADAAERLVMLVGASGSGKSSLMLAGVLPRIGRLAEGWIVVPPFTPEDRPMERLARSLARAFGDALSWQACHARLEAPAGFAGLIDDLRDASDGARNVLLAIDQGEQLVTRCPPTIRTVFFEQLAVALERSATTRVILTLRSEYLSGMLASTPLEGQAATTMPLGRLAPMRLAEVIEKPAQRAGIEFEAGLVTRMVEETRAGAAGGGDALPLLAFLLRRVYDGRADPTRISRADYEKVGGVGGALRVQADRVRSQLNARNAGAAIVPTLLALVQLEAERDPTGRSVTLDDFDPGGQAVVRAFVDAGLLTTGGEGPTVRVAHEALFTEWPLISRAIEESRDALLARSRLDRDAREWEAADRDPSYLIGGGRLRAALQAYEGNPNARADTLATRFLTLSRRQARRSAWRGRALIGLAAIVAVALAAGALMYALDRVREASRRDSARAELVTLPTAAVDQHEVTYSQYRLCVREGACQPLPSSGIGPDFEDALDTAAVVFIDANQARAFCTWIDRRLPRVAELRAGAFASGVAHLLEQMEGREWTSTRRGIALQTVARNLDARRVDISAVNGSQRDLDLGFRCAA